MEKSFEDLAFKKDGGTVGAVGITDISGNDELALMGSTEPRLGTKNRGVRLLGTHTIIDCDQTAIGTPGANVADNLVVTGLTSDGKAILGYSTPADPAYKASDSSTSSETVGEGSGESAWVSLGAVITLGKSIEAYGYQFYADAYFIEFGGQEGFVEFGVGLNAAEPLDSSEPTSISSEFAGTISTSGIGEHELVNNDTLTLYARGIGSNVNFAVSVDGAISPSKFSIRENEATSQPSVYLFDKATAVTITAVQPTYQEINRLAIGDIVAGTYEFKLSLTYNLDIITRSVYIRFSVDGGSTWTTFISEPKDITDDVPFTYFFPYVLAAQNQPDFILEMAKEDVSDNLLVHFSDIMFESKSY